MFKGTVQMLENISLQGINENTTSLECLNHIFTLLNHYCKIDTFKGIVHQKI